jgi:aldehyde:ferredoxin oxidoreductase
MAWHGKILRVDLSRRFCTSEELNMEWARAYLGLRGLGSRYLMEEMDPQTDPLAPENRLIFATGPLTGTAASTGGRYGVITKGALTGAIACSNSGGHFGAELKFAGWDMLIIEGRATEPVYLWIENETVEIKPANGFIWGKTHWDTEALLRERHGGGIRVAGIGVSGEKGVRYACIMNDYDRAAGRSGVGAVMGSKNLKAIAIHGTGGVAVRDGKAFAEAVQSSHVKLAESRGRKGLTRYGTNAMMNMTGHFGALPTRNEQDCQFEGSDKIGAEAMRTSPGPGRQANLIANKACFGCTIGCGRVSRIQPDHFSLEHGGHYGKPGGGLEYESAYSLGAMVGVDDLDAATFANMVCNEQGMDPISFGATLSAAIELFEQGRLTAEDTGGRQMAFGDAHLLANMAVLTGKAEGFGAELGLGSRRLCEKYGAPELSMSVKGQEFPGYDPRAMQGMGLAYATSSRGACHLRADPFGTDFKTPDPAVKAAIIKDSQDENAVIDALGICAFTTTALSLDDYCDHLNADLDGDWTKERLLEIGERIWTLERMFNLGAGLTRADDTLPPRMFREKLKSGTNKGDVSHLDVMLPEYYRRRGWTEAGVPTNETLSRLGL